MRFYLVGFEGRTGSRGLTRGSLLFETRGLNYEGSSEHNRVTLGRAAVARINWHADTFQQMNLWNTSSELD